MANPNEESSMEGFGMTGILPDCEIEGLLARNEVYANEDFVAEQVQPSSLDVRLGAKAYRLRASFLPGRETLVSEKISHLALHEIDLRQGAVLETGGVYIVPLLESLALDSKTSAFANPKSSTGRIDVFTRVIVDRSAYFDQIETNYKGPVYLEVSPRTFPIRVRQGSTLAQLRFRQGAPTDPDTEIKNLLGKGWQLTSRDVDISGGLGVRVGLRPAEDNSAVGFRARRHAGCVDVDARDHPSGDFWEPVYADSRGAIVLDPGEFYILASQEKLCVPPSHAAVMAPFDPLMGEVRVHYAGFFDPGFGVGENNMPSSLAVLEVRGRDVPFILENGQIIARLIYEPLRSPAQRIYGRGLGSNYQYQGLRLSKHFR
ncbi:MAG: 2'-deoxycytidine 5'-triphosphate deaminase [Hyphomicrobiales bacterium]|nr:2'-deoxycytidine 5'-triphosphate deaminase [Hyphomicrobiales bacterium]